MSRKYPDGPRIHLAIALLQQAFPVRYPSDPLAFHIGLARDYGDLAYFRFGPLRVYQLNDPKLIGEVLVGQAPKFHKPTILKRAARRTLGQGLLSSDGELWKQQRKLIQPAFRHDRLAAAYSGAITAEVAKLAATFSTGEVRDIGRDMSRLSMAIIVKALFGENLPFPAAEIGELLVAFGDTANQRLNSILQLPDWIPFARHRRERRLQSRLQTIVNELIHACRTSPLGDDLLSYLIGTGMPDRKLHDEVMTLFLAGQDTTAHALTWIWYLLARHPEVENRLAIELQSGVAGPNADMVVREAMRLYPPAPMFARQPIEDVTLGEWKIPKGSLVFVSVYALHRDPRFFPEPDRFLPERFAAGWEERIPRFAYVPFGGGPRTCIGNGFAMLEARLVLAALTPHWKFGLETDAEIAPRLQVTLRPASPVRVRIEARTKACAQSAIAS